MSVIQPSAILITRFPYSAFRSLWVTWTIVVPPSFSFLKSSMISLPWLECRLPVGSSARIDFGIGHDSACDGYQLLLSARELVGIEILFSDDLESIQHVADDAVAFAFLDVAIGERDVEVFVNGERIQQMIALKDEAEVFLVQLHAIFLVELVDGVLDQVIFTGPRAIVHSEQVQQSGFARAQGPMMETNSPSLISALMRRRTKSWSARARSTSRRSEA